MGKCGGQGRGAWLLVFLCSWHAAVTRGTRRFPILKAWMPRSCRWYDVKAAFMSYAQSAAWRRTAITGHGSLLEAQGHQKGAAVAP